MCEMLLAAGEDINQSDQYGQSLIAVAVNTGDIAIVKFLLFSGINVPRNGAEALHRAASCDFTEIIPSGSIDKSKTSAIEIGTEMVRILLAAGASPNVTVCGYELVLHVAAELGFLEMFVLLLQSGPLIEAWDDRGYTPLHRAACKGNASVVSQLLLHGAQIEARTRTGSNYRGVDRARKRTEKVWPKRASAETLHYISRRRVIMPKLSEFFSKMKLCLTHVR